MPILLKGIDEYKAFLTKSKYFINNFYFIKNIFYLTYSSAKTGR